MFCPEKPSGGNERAGCWSTALAQITYYHRLQPLGNVTFDPVNYPPISVDFDDYQFDWSVFVDAIEAATPPASANEVARYIYHLAAAVQKDFGTGSYLLGHQGRADALETHFSCETELHHLSPAETEPIIRAEIEAQRPVMMHLRSVGEDPAYHAVVVDGVHDQGEQVLVHINSGNNGGGDGWYSFYDAIGSFDDNSYRKIITVRPLAD